MFDVWQVYFKVLRMDLSTVIILLTVIRVIVNDSVIELYIVEN